MSKSPICRPSIVLASLLFFLGLVLERPVLAVNRVFLSTSLEFSEATYLIQFTANSGGDVDKIHLTFPPGMLDDQVSLRSLVVGDRSVKPSIVSIDPANADAFVIDVPKTVAVKAGSPIQVELLGLKNPTAGTHQVEIDLLGTRGAVLEIISPIVLSITSAGIEANAIADD